MIKITLLVQDSHVTVISIKLRTFIEFTRKNNERDIDFFFFFKKHESIAYLNFRRFLALSKINIYHFSKIPEMLK